MEGASSLSIGYFGDDAVWSTALHRHDALRRLGHKTELFGLDQIICKSNRILNKLHFLTGHVYRQPSILLNLKRRLQNKMFDVGWVDSGWWCGPKVANLLRMHCKKLLLFNVDDPTGKREPCHWRSLKLSFPAYDLAVVVRKESLFEFRSMGFKNVVRVWRGYDEIAHDLSTSACIEPTELVSDVSFIGTQMENRSEFLTRLVQLGVPLSIWGTGWEKGNGWSVLRPFYRGGALYGAQYVAAIQRSKVSLGFLSRLNRDLHTQRSAEIPFAGGLACMQRTTEHNAMFEDGVEAVFWDSPDECAKKCLELINNGSLRERIKEAGRQRVLALNVGNENTIRYALDSLFANPDRASTPLLAEGAYYLSSEEKI